jgi:plastocyanin
MGGDRACAQVAGPNPTNDAVIVAPDGALQNAFVYIKGGLDPAYRFDPATATVELDQKGCRYVPRVVGLRVGQTLEIMNNDDTLHNVHALPMANQEFNQGLQSRGSRMQKTFTVPEVMVRFKCDVHGWMSAWVGVVPHPYFAVTKADGTFELKGVPPGTYTMEAWHEKFGTQTATVTVTDHQAQTVAFQFGAAAGK